MDPKSTLRFLHITTENKSFFSRGYMSTILLILAHFWSFEDFSANVAAIIFEFSVFWLYFYYNMIDVFSFFMKKQTVFDVSLSSRKHFFCQKKEKKLIFSCFIECMKWFSGFFSLFDENSFNLCELYMDLKCFFGVY